LGTSPIHAEKSRPDRKAFGSATLATKAVGQRRTHARDLIQPLTRRIGSMTGHNLTVEVENLRLQRPQLGAESKEAGAGNLRQPFVAYIGDHIEQLFNAIASDRCDDAKFCEMGADRIDHRGLLANEQVTGAI
jgi:hypothetical protein